MEKISTETANIAVSDLITNTVKIMELHSTNGPASEETLKQRLADAAKELAGTEFGKNYASIHGGKIPYAVIAGLFPYTILDAHNLALSVVAEYPFRAGDSPLVEV